MQEQELTDHERYELFRRAIVDRDDDAWMEIYALYRPLLLIWARHCRMRVPGGEQCEDIADRALSRAWSALTPEQFGEFPNLAALLAYLRTCVSAAAIDSARAEATRERAYQKLGVPDAVSPEEQVVGKLSRAELWRLLYRLVSNEHERLILVESFALALPPRMILERHQDCFTDVPEIYGIKRNLLNRLERSQALQQFYQELNAA